MLDRSGTHAKTYQYEFRSPIIDFAFATNARAAKTLWKHVESPGLFPSVRREIFSDFSTGIGCNLNNPPLSILTVPAQQRSGGYTTYEIITITRFTSTTPVVHLYCDDLIFFFAFHSHLCVSIFSWILEKRKSSKRIFIIYLKHISSWFRVLREPWSPYLPLPL